VVEIPCGFKSRPAHHQTASGWPISCKTSRMSNVKAGLKAAMAQKRPRSRRPRARIGLPAIAIVAIALDGCAFSGKFFADPVGPDSGPGPHVANCTLIQQATPALYVCDGKTYTATQLYDIRNGKQATPCDGPGSQSSGSPAKPNPACFNVQHY
jgi:hypothetical protein